MPTEPMPAYRIGIQEWAAPAQSTEPSISEPAQLSTAVVQNWPNESLMASMVPPKVSITRICTANSTDVNTSRISARPIEPKPSVMHSR